jgi:transcriptional regulator with XRE-family HTH domain
LEDRRRRNAEQSDAMAARRLKHAFGKVLRDCRLEKGLSQERLGFEASLTRNYISLVELGQRSPTLDTVEALAQALGISASALIARAERKQR